MIELQDKVQKIHLKIAREDINRSADRLKIVTLFQSKHNYGIIFAEESYAPYIG